MSALEMLEKRWNDLSSRRNYSEADYRAEFTELERKILYTASFESRQESGRLAAELARLQAIERAFFKIVAPDGFHQCGMNEDCPECEQECIHAPNCALAAALANEEVR